MVPGYFADMILFDPNTINTSATYRKDDLPAKSDRLIVDPIGIKEIWVNGVNKNENTYKTNIKNNGGFCLIRLDENGNQV